MEPAVLSLPEVGQALEAANDPGSCCQESDAISLGRLYFSRLDLLTNPAVSLLDESRIHQLSEIMSVLRTRVLLRRKTERTDNCKLPTCSTKAVKAISTLILAVSDATFGRPGILSDSLQLIGMTHDLFACGKLRTPSSPGVRVPNNVPDSATIFFFPEFAHLACDCGVGAKRWEALLPILTRMPALYLKAHLLCDLGSFPKPFDDFGLVPCIEAHWPQLRTFAIGLRRRYDILNREGLGFELGRLALQAFNNTS